MISLDDKSQCSGCTACEAICPHHAISMKPDELGFLYPKVDGSKCVECGLCVKVCSFKAPEKRGEGFPKSYVMKHKIPDEIQKSKSGAAFVALSDVILRDNGIVYGAKLDSKHLVKHDVATDPEERDAFRGSKYIQSDLHGIFSNIKQDLLEGRIVLFSGTPWQAAGLKSYIGSRLSKNLYIVDILCHGVASPAIWQEHIRQIESKKNSRIIKIIPRNPKFGWAESVDTFVLEDGRIYNSDFFSGFVYHKWITQRWSCNSCPFTSLNRVSDVTIGDAWGIGNAAPGFDKDNTGASLILVNNEKGQSLFAKSSEDMLYQEVNLQKMMQPVLKHPTKLHSLREEFEVAYVSKGYKYAKRKYLNFAIPAFKIKTLTTLRVLKSKLIGWCFQ